MDDFGGIAAANGDDDVGELQEERQEQQVKYGHYDQYHKLLRQLEQRQVASRIAGMFIIMLMTLKSRVTHLLTQCSD